MFFGLCNSPTTFQTMMNDILQDFIHNSVGGIIVCYPAHLYSQVLMPAVIQQFSTSIQCFFDQKSCLWAALIYPLPIFHFPNPFQTLTQLCHRIEPVFTITTVLHSTLYLFWKPRYGSCRFFVYTFFLSNPSSPDTCYRSLERPYRGDPDAVKIVGIGSGEAEIFEFQVRGIELIGYSQGE